MAAFDAVTEEPPPWRHWDDPDLDVGGELGVWGADLQFEWEWKDSASDTISPSLLLIATSELSVVLLHEIVRVAEHIANAGHVGQVDGGKAIAAATDGEGHFQHVATLRGLSAIASNRSSSISSRKLDQVCDGVSGTGRSKTIKAFLFWDEDSNAALLTVDDHTMLQQHPQHCFHWTRTLFAHVKPSSTIVLGSMPRPMLRALPTPTADVDVGGGGGGTGQRARGDQGSANTFLAGDDNAWTSASASVLRLQTSSFRGSLSEAVERIPFLPQGNVVDGVQAAIVSHCEARGMECVLLTEAEEVDGGHAQSSLAVMSHFLYSLLQHGIQLCTSEEVAVVASNTQRRIRDASQARALDMYA